MKQLSASTSADGAGEEFLCLIKISGSSLKDGDAVFCLARSKHHGNKYGFEYCFLRSMRLTWLVNQEETWRSLSL